MRTMANEINFGFLKDEKVEGLLVFSQKIVIEKW